MRLLTLPAVAGLAFAGSIMVGGDAAWATTAQAPYGAPPATAPSAVILALSDVHVDQATGRLPRGKLPEIGKDKKNGSDSTAGNHRPQTCDSSNATSQSCATATQQVRPLAK